MIQITNLSLIIFETKNRVGSSEKRSESRIHPSHGSESNHLRDHILRHSPEPYDLQDIRLSQITGRYPSHIWRYPSHILRQASPAQSSESRNMRAVRVGTGRPVRDIVPRLFRRSILHSSHVPGACLAYFCPDFSLRIVTATISECPNQDSEYPSRDSEFPSRGAAKHHSPTRLLVCASE